MKRVFTLGAGLLAVALSATTMDLPTAWKTARAHNPRLRQGSAALTAARTQVEVESTDRLPGFGVKSGYQYMSDVSSMSLFGNKLEMGTHDRWDFAVSVSQPIFTGYRTRGRIAGAQTDTLVARANLEQSDDAICLQVAALFAEVSALDAQNNVLRSGIDRADRQLIRLRSLYIAKLATPLDTLETANRRIELQTAITRNEHARRILLARLQEVVGVPCEPTVTPLSPHPLRAEDFLSAAMDSRPELAAVRARQQRCAQNRTIALSALYPQLVANAEYHYGTPGQKMINPDWGDYYTVGLQMQWNPFDWGKARETARVADLNKLQLTAEEDLITARIEREITENVEQLNSLDDQIKLQRILAAQEVERRETVRNRYEQGQSTAPDLRDAEAKATDAECEIARLLAQWTEAYYQLQFACGNIGGDL
jgi:outer membrane protein TolC